MRIYALIVVAFVTAPAADARIGLLRRQLGNNGSGVGWGWGNDNDEDKSSNSNWNNGNGNGNSKDNGRGDDEKNTHWKPAKLKPSTSSMSNSIDSIQVQTIEVRYDNFFNIPTCLFIVI